MGGKLGMGSCENWGNCGRGKVKNCGGGRALGIGPEGIMGKEGLGDNGSNGFVGEDERLFDEACWVKKCHGNDSRNEPASSFVSP